MIKEIPNAENETLELTKILPNNTWNKMQQLIQAKTNNLAYQTDSAYLSRNVACHLMKLV